MVIWLSILIYILNLDLRIKLIDVLKINNSYYALYLQPAAPTEWLTNLILKFDYINDVKKYISFDSQEYIKDKAIFIYIRDDYEFEDAYIKRESDWLLFWNNNIYYWAYNTLSNKWFLCNNDKKSWWNNYLNFFNNVDNEFKTVDCKNIDFYLYKIIIYIK